MKSAESKMEAAADCSTTGDPLEKCLWEKVDENNKF